MCHPNGIGWVGFRKILDRLFVQEIHVAGTQLATDGLPLLFIIV